MLYRCLQSEFVLVYIFKHRTNHYDRFFLANDHFQGVVTTHQFLFLFSNYFLIFYKLKHQSTYFLEILHFFSSPT